MPTTTMMEDYNALLPRLQALQAWAHANGMPYALPGTLNGGDTGSQSTSAANYWADKWAHEYIREDVPVYENNAARVTIYPAAGDGGTDPGGGAGDHDERFGHGSFLLIQESV